MKKLLTVGFAFLLAACLLVGCGGPNGGPSIEPGTDLGADPEKYPPSGGTVEVRLPEGLTGTDTAKLLLANERLNFYAPKGSIFDNGVEVFENLANIARENLIRVTYVGTNATPVLLGGTEKGEALERYACSDGSYVEIDGDIYRWKNFAEYSNSYSYFENISSNVITSAEAAAKLIDEIKTHVRILDTWVEMGDTAYYLHVEEDMEILYSRWHDDIDICRRTKTADGKNMYELFRSSDSHEMRMIYIPGELYEFSYEFFENHTNHDFVATNTKGFWEVVDIGRAPSHYNVSCMVLKDDICYDALYDTGTIKEWEQATREQAFKEQYGEDPSLWPMVEEVEDEQKERIARLKVISADRQTDLLHYTNVEDGVIVELALQGFDGISCIEVQASPDHVGHAAEAETKPLYVSWAPIVELDPSQSEGKRFFIANYDQSVLVTQNGTRLRAGDTYLDGKIIVQWVAISHFIKDTMVDGYSPMLELRFATTDHAEIMADLQAFLDEVGMTCRRDLNYVTEGVARAHEELAEFVKYHTWQGESIETNEGLARGFAARAEKFAFWRELYAEVKDAPVVQYGSKDAELLVRFSPVEIVSASSVVADGLTVQVNAISLQTKDTMLFVEDESYAVHFAILGLEEGAREGLTHILLEGGTVTVYEDQKEFTVAQDDVTFLLPFLSPGQYTVVAYIATADGIRVSEYIPVLFEDVKGEGVTDGNLQAATAHRDDGALLISYAIIENAYVTVEGEEGYDYETLRHILGGHAYDYGYADADAVLEMQAEDGSWQSLNGDETALSYGIYRLRYSLLNGEYEMHGYVIATYTAVTEQPDADVSPEKPDVDAPIEGDVVVEPTE